MLISKKIKNKLHIIVDGYYTFFKYFIVGTVLCFLMSYTNSLTENIDRLKNVFNTKAEIYNFNTSKKKKIWQNAVIDFDDPFHITISVIKTGFHFDSFW